MHDDNQQQSDTARGVSRLAFDAVEQATKVVEMMHANIAAASPPVGKGTNGRTRGITGFVYGSIRTVSRASSSVLDLILGQVKGSSDRPLPSAQADALVSAANGVVGDHLVTTSNPLAIAMRLRSRGQALTLERDALSTVFPEPSGKILVAVHGACMNDRQWHRNGQDHCAALARELDYTPVYLHYNTGRHISENGREFAEVLEELVDSWPVPVTELNVLAHSMGGLVTRSACHYGATARHRWLASLRRVVFLGTPHHGAPLARGGHSLQNILGFSPYTAPFARLTSLRSVGITDLRYGNLLDEDWQDLDDLEQKGDPRQVVPLPTGAECYAVAATLGENRGDLEDRLIGDGLVPVASALGQHRDAERALAIPDANQHIHYKANHWDLLSDPTIYAQLLHWHTGGHT